MSSASFASEGNGWGDIPGFNNAGGAANCVACSAGSTSTAGSSSCTPCLAGTYGIVTMGAGLCLPCPAGYFSGSAGLTSCTRCATGLNSQAGSSACTSLTSTTSSPARRELSLADGNYTVTGSASSAMVLGSALRSQMAGMLGVDVSYILVSAADTTCAGTPVVFVHDTFGSGDDINSDVLFGGAAKSNPSNYVYKAPQGPLQQGVCTVEWTVILQTPVGAPPPTYGAVRIQPFTAKAVAAVAAYMGANPATATGTMAVETGSEPSSSPSSSPSEAPAPSPEAVPVEAPAAAPVAAPPSDISLSSGAFAGSLIGAAVGGIALCLAMQATLAIFAAKTAAGAAVGSVTAVSSSASSASALKLGIPAGQV